MSKAAAGSETPTWTALDGRAADEGTSLPQLIREAAARAPDRPAIVDVMQGRSLSYASLADRIQRVAAALAARGFGPGEVVAVHAPNTAPWAGVSIGAMAAGGAVTGVSPLATRPEISSQLTDSNASILVTAPELADGARAAAAATGVREVISIGETPGTTPIRKLLACDAPAPDASLDPDGIALLPYSSGTTGLPKGVMLTHRNLAAAVGQLCAGLRPTSRDSLLALAPFAHVMGFVVSLATPLAAGATVVTMGRFDLDAALSAIERQRITILPVPPPVFAALARHPAIRRHDLSSLELIVSGGAPLSAELQEEVGARFPRAAVGQGYGLTETTAVIPVPDRDHGTPPGSVGPPAPDTEVRVVDPMSGRDLGPGNDGELWARGPQVMAGYLGRPEATAEMIDRDGWLRTGDLGHVDAEGNLHVVDRLKELIKVNAYQVAPAELEALLTSRPDIADAAVIPRPDERTGEVPVAVIVPRARLDCAEIVAWAADRVAPHKRIHEVRVVDEIPRTPAGKILRRLLIEDDRKLSG